MIPTSHRRAVALPPQRTAATTAEPTGPDWTFLAGRPALGRVGFSGTTPPADLDAERLDGRSAQDPPFDTIILQRPDAARVDAAITALSADGTIRLEEVARHRRAALVRQLDDAGFEVCCWWHRPDLVDTWAIVGLDRPAAAAEILRGVAGRHRRGRYEAILARTGVARRWAPTVTYTARRRSSAITALAAARPDRPVDALLTPRFQSSLAVLGITVQPDGGVDRESAKGHRVAYVTKIARSPRDDASIVREAEALQHFRDLVDDPHAAPRSHHLEERHGRAVLVEAGAEGTPLDRRAVRRDPVGALAAGVAWLERAPSTAPSIPAHDGRGRRLLDHAVATVARVGGPRQGERSDALGRADRLLDHVRSLELPVVFEHGDLSHPNLFRRPDGGLTVVDWERAEPAGLPGHDLCYFTAYLAESVGRPRDAEELVLAQRAATGPGGWARSVLDRHLRDQGLDEEQAALLDLAAWTRYLAALTATPARLEQPSPHRCEVLWLESLHRAEEVLA